MNRHTKPYQIIDLPPARRAMAGFNDLNAGKHPMYGLLEVDVTVARQFIAEHKAHTGETLSFTGYLAFCLARAVGQDKIVQAYMKGRKQLIVCDDVDVGLMIEHNIGSKRVLLGHVIQGANHKTYAEIHREIRAKQASAVPPTGRMASLVRSAMLLPWPLSRLFNALIRRVMRHDPTIATSMAGTVGITAVGMFGKHQRGWALSPVMHSLDLIVGSISWQPAVVEGRIEPRQILNLTVVFDHDVIDGAPAARFTRQLVELIERGEGLVDQSTAALATEPAAAQATGVTWYAQA
jgi:pyruvate/2-oxoglutarate dehydrogenase complex dihydrolipoamide acyltransferase (E2) component